MTNPKEDRLISAALQRGLLRAEDLGWLDEYTATREVGSGATRWGIRIDSLVERGFLSEADVEALERETSAGPDAGSTSMPSSEDGKDFDNPVEGWDRYQILALLGAGGMGKVYKAFDPRLRRYVAVKFIHGDNPDHIKRFMQEAQAQARIEHDYVCKTYEVGEVNKKPYIAMQYIDGQTLNRVQDSLTLEEKVVLMQQVAEAVQAAHRLGIIHRDLKPSNIMVERTDEGRWRPSVMDFGLAREIATDGLTMTGVVMGTPWYMSPEQATGSTNRLDRRSDVYSLGATFYDLLAHTPPFLGSGASVLVKLTQEEPPPLRTIDRSIPEDLETIIMKCLEKEPQRRYDSARELAADLRRYLEGEPIQARPATWTYRVVKKARKHRVAVVAVSFALLVSVVSLGMWLHGRWTAAARATLAQRLGQEVEKLEGTLRQIYTLPLHDVRREKAMIRTEMERVAEQVTREMGTVGEASGSYALGRISLALQQYDKARVHLERAWKMGYREPEVAYALGRVMGELYQREMDEAAKLGSKQQQAAQRREIAKLYGQPALTYLEASRGLKMESPEYTEALIAYCEGNYDEALKKAETSFRNVPWLYEAKLLMGDILTEVGSRRRETGDLDGAWENYREAEAAYADAIRIAESDVRGYRDLCEVCSRELYVEIHGRGRDLEQIKDKALTACDQALKVDPDAADTLIEVARVHSNWADYWARRGMDPSEDLEISVSALERVLKADPGDADAHANLALAYWERAKYESEHGKDAIGDLQAAIQSAGMAVTIQPNLTVAVNALGLAYMDRGVAELRVGKDPSASLSEAIRHLQKDAELEPDAVRPVLNLGIANYLKGSYECTHGADPRASLNAAVEALSRGAGMNPAEIYAPRFLVAAYRSLGEYGLWNGSDPRPALSDALRSYEAVLKLSPHDLISSLEACGALTIRALFEMDGGRSPEKDLASARECARRALDTDPTISVVYQCAGEIDIVQARWHVLNGISPDAAFERARLALMKGHQLNPVDSELCAVLADLCRWRAHSRSVHRQDPSRDIRQGLDWIEKALQIDHTNAEALATRGALYLIQARAEPDPLEKEKSLQAAKEALSQAVSFNANLAHRLAPHIEEAAAHTH
ncbi:MAG: protein kinase [Acidobacteria bacterium]|nr:protein kinase [Acidobacteriota bacterium]